jgi:hypothetical protein
MSDARDCELEPLPRATAAPAEALEAEEQDASRVVVATIVRPLLDHEREGVLCVCQLCMQEAPSTRANCGGALLRVKPSSRVSCLPCSKLR